MMQVIQILNTPTFIAYEVVCPLHQTRTQFGISALECAEYRGDVQELIQVAAHQAVLAKCEGCLRDQISSLPATRFPEGAEL